METKETEQEIFDRRSIRTVALRKDEWLDNVKANAPHIKQDVGALWKDVGIGEGIAVAGGPSLVNDMAGLKSMRAGREVVVVDAAFKQCLESGVVPDYVVTCDASGKIMQMLKDAGDIPTKLLANVSVNPMIHDVWKGEIYWFVLANNVFDKDYGEMLQNMHTRISKVSTRLIPGGNVSSEALAFMLHVRNSDKLYLYGFDFCWKTDMYAGGKFKELERERMEAEGKAGTIVEAVNTKGEKVMTNMSMKNFCSWHKTILQHYKKRVINKTSSSLLDY